METETDKAPADERATVHVMVRPATWTRLKDHKDFGMTMDDVISGLLDDADAARAEDSR